jgi:hypothetical protein
MLYAAAEVVACIFGRWRGLFLLLSIQKAEEVAWYREVRE